MPLEPLTKFTFTFVNFFFKLSLTRVPLQPCDKTVSRKKLPTLIVHYRNVVHYEKRQQHLQLLFMWHWSSKTNDIATQRCVLRYGLSVRWKEINLLEYSVKFVDNGYI